jgi:hypothetical protein
LTAEADTRDQQRGIMLQSGDYDSFKIPGARGAGACAEACERDPRCRAWTYVRPVEQCRLKFEIGIAVENNCCISGIKERKSGDSRQVFCADYASQAVSANDANLAQQCRLTGARWSADYRAHFSWCLRVDRADAMQETELRSAEIVRCRRRADRASRPLCEHYSRMAMIMINAQKRAECGFNPASNRWRDDRELHIKVCEGAPQRIPAAEFEARQRQLATCFERAGKEEQACVTYADEAVAQYVKAVAANCEFEESRKWNSSKARHYVWCLEASERQREDLSFERDDDLSDCRRQAALRKACDDYAENAIEQAALNENERCGLRGEAWSKYKDDHVAHCMRDGEKAARRLATERQSDLESCIADNNARNEDCERYADRAVRLARVNEEKSCGNRDRRMWSTNSREHYDFCMRAKPAIRQEVQQARRKAIQSCSVFRGFRIEIQF